MILTLSYVQIRKQLESDRPGYSISRSIPVLEPPLRAEHLEPPLDLAARPDLEIENGNEIPSPDSGQNTQNPPLIWLSRPSEGGGGFWV